MKIVEALRAERYGMRVSYSVSERWIVWDSVVGAWLVFERKYAQKKTRTILETTDEDEAVAALLDEGGRQ